MKKLLLVGLCALMLGGCGTLFQGLQVQGPAVFGGIRLDIEQFDHPGSHTGDKVFYCLDLPFSLVGDLLLLPFAEINELYEGGIDVEPQNPKTLGDPRYVGSAEPQGDDRVLLADTVVPSRS